MAEYSQLHPQGVYVKFTTMSLPYIGYHTESQRLGFGFSVSDEFVDQINDEGATDENSNALLPAIKA